ncbi:contractile injection system protein, VgrG/Pvc8 family [Undibacterium sp. Xuan67W]|uniref:contractile injection system protein, VgrG/Pvc8 family n=1 Tax=Undibacterium sp. Xuan67W TaxID=3413057 RepID=UPI003BF21E3B
MNDILNPAARSAIAAIERERPTLFLHCAIFLRGNRIVSDETFRLVNFQGQESVSEPFEYQLELHGNTSQHHGDQFNFNQVIGHPITVGITYAFNLKQTKVSDSSEQFQRVIRGAECSDELAIFNGIVTSFSFEIQGVYRITMKPSLHRLTLTNHYRVHAQCNIRDAIGNLLDAHRIPYSLEAVSGKENPAIARIQDWLQAGETDFDFLKRLMGKAHLYYYFVHVGNSHKIVFGNRPSYEQVFSNPHPLRYTFTSMDELGMAQSDVISQYSYQCTMASSGVHGVFTRQEAAWEADAVATFQSFRADDSPDIGELPFRQYKIYQYGCSNDEIRHYTDTTSDTLHSAASQFSGNSFCAHFRCGHQFSLTGSDIHESSPNPVRPSLEGEQFVLTMVKHQASADGTYSNEFQSTEANGLISIFSIQETQQGTILAQVVAKSGSATPLDWRYYAPVSPFDPETSTVVDTQGTDQKLNAIGVYVRLSTDDIDADPIWIKLSPSMQTVPEIGTTVVVSRAQDESELPEIQSIIQSNASTVVMPSTWTANTHVGSSYSTSYGDGKSIRYGKYSSPALSTAINIVSAPYDRGHYRDTSFSQGASYSYSTAETVASNFSPDPAELYGPYAGAADILSASESFGSNYNRQYATITSSFSKVGTSYNNSTTGLSENYSTTTTHRSTSKTGTSITNDTTGSSSSTQKIGTSYSKTTTDYSENYSDTTTHHSTSKTGTSITKDTTDSTDSTQKVGTSKSSVTTDSSSSNSITGSSISASVIGSSINTSTTGSSISNANTGLSLNNSNTLVSAVVNITGSSTVMNITGNNNTIDVVGPGFKFTNQALQPHIEDVDLRLTVITILQIFM